MSRPSLALIGFAAACILAAPISALAADSQAFATGGPTVLVSATTTPQTITLQGGGNALLIVSACTVPVRVEASGNTATTPTTSVPGSFGLPATSVGLIRVGSLVSTVSVKVDSGSACNIELTRGEGMAH